MNLGPCWIYDVNLAASVQNNRNSAFFLEYPVLGSLVRPIINNTITKTFVFCSILSFGVNLGGAGGRGGAGAGVGAGVQTLIYFNAIIDYVC